MAVIVLTGGLDNAGSVGRKVLLEAFPLTLLLVKTRCLRETNTWFVLV